MGGGDAAGATRGSSYLRRAAADAALVGSRAEMTRCYMADVARLRAAAPPPPPRRDGTLRVVTWNINVLCGAGGSASVGGLERIDPDLVADVLRDTDADVLCLQEAIDWVPPAFVAHFEKNGVGDVAERMARLDARLRRDGYTTLVRSCAAPSPGNPCLLATRLRVAGSGAIPLPAPGFGGGADPRSAAWADVAAGAAVVRVYAAHLHHVEEEGRVGRRAAEVAALLRHAAGGAAGRAATVIAGDFNQPRREDYTAAEWAVVAAGLRRVRQPGDDGVAAAVRRAGFACAYAAPPPRGGAPPFTHWTGACVDYCYVRGDSAEARGAGSHTVFSALSDHLPVVVDVAVGASRHSDRSPAACL